MPHSELHKKKRTKNFVVLSLIIAFMAMIWMITMIRMANAGDILGLPNKFEEQQNSHLENTDKLKEKFFERGAVHLDEIDKMKDDFFKRGAEHQEEIDKAKEAFFNQGALHQQDIDDRKIRYFEQGAIHMKEIDAAFKRWWYSDQASDLAKAIMKKKQAEKQKHATAEE